MPEACYLCIPNFTRMNSWFTVKVKYTKQLENGTFKRVSEPYLLAAMTFTDAEARIYRYPFWLVDHSLFHRQNIARGVHRFDP